jgi:hypothetical protein
VHPGEQSIQQIHCSHMMLKNVAVEVQPSDGLVLKNVWLLCRCWTQRPWQHVLASWIAWRGAVTHRCVPWVLVNTPSFQWRWLCRCIQSLPRAASCHVGYADTSSKPCPGQPLVMLVMLIHHPIPAQGSLLSCWLC